MPPTHSCSLPATLESRRIASALGAWARMLPWRRQATQMVSVLEHSTSGRPLGPAPLPQMVLTQGRLYNEAACGVRRVNLSNVGRLLTPSLK